MCQPAPSFYRKQQSFLERQQPPPSPIGRYYPFPTPATNDQELWARPSEDGQFELPCRVSEWLFWGIRTGFLEDVGHLFLFFLNLQFMLRRVPTVVQISPRRSCLRRRSFPVLLRSDNLNRKAQLLMYTLPTGPPTDEPGSESRTQTGSTPRVSEILHDLLRDATHETKFSEVCIRASARETSRRALGTKLCAKISQGVRRRPWRPRQPFSRSPLWNEDPSIPPSFRRQTCSDLTLTSCPDMGTAIKLSLDRRSEEHGLVMHSQ